MGKIKLPDRWYHKVKGWKYSKDCGCYYITDFHAHPYMYCLGNRMIHADYGYDSYDIYWTGSTSEAWHGGYRGNDLGKAIRWVRGARHKKVGCYLWGDKNEK